MLPFRTFLPVGVILSPSPLLAGEFRVCNSSPQPFGSGLDVGGVYLLRLVHDDLPLVLVLGCGVHQASVFQTCRSNACIFVVATRMEPLALAAAPKAFWLSGLLVVRAPPNKIAGRLCDVSAQNAFCGTKANLRGYTPSRDAQNRIKARMELRTGDHPVGGRPSAQFVRPAGGQAES